MTGGLQQQARVARHVADEEARKYIGHIERQLQPPVIAPAEDLQADYNPPIGDAGGLIRSLGWPRMLAAAAFAITIWTATAAFAVMCGAPR